MRVVKRWKATAAHASTTPREEPVQACEHASEREREHDKGVGRALALEGRSYGKCLTI